MNMGRPRLAHCITAALVAFCSATSVAGYPDRPLRIVVPYPAGGPVDITARALGPKLTEALGETVVVDNRGGAGGVLGSDIVAKSAPDGYTLLMCTTANAINASLLRALPYDMVKDFAPVSLLVIIPRCRSIRFPTLLPMPRRGPASSLTRPPATARRRTLRPSSSRP